MPLSHRNSVNFNCGDCGGRTPTGFEKRIRKVWEVREAAPFPKVTAGRAMGLATAIYDTANESARLRIDRATRHNLHERTGDAWVCRVVDKKLIKGRGGKFGGDGKFKAEVHDGSVVAAVVVVRNANAHTFPHSIYVVFRGSVGDINTNGAGWDDDHLDDGDLVNVDWHANFDNHMVKAGWCAGTIRVHRGFKHLLKSYWDKVEKAILTMRHRYHHSNLVVTGHSLGAGQAILFTHRYSYRHHKVPFCFPFSPPRAGNYAFAKDFTNRITNRTVILPYDGPVSAGAYLMVLGHDPVTTGQKHAFDGRKFETKADLTNILSKGLYARRKEGAIRRWKRNIHEMDIYFHPKKLIRVKGSWIKWVPKVNAVDHEPNRFLNKVGKTEQ